MRPHVWYFAVSDCNGTLQNGTQTLQVEFRARQEDKSEFSAEQRWSLTFGGFNWAAFTFFLADFCRRCRDFSQSAGTVHPVIWALGAAVLLQYVSLCSSMGHLTLYSRNGYGNPALSLLSDIIAVMSQVLLTSLLIAIAMGYTLIKDKLEDMENVMPLCMFVAIFHLVLLGCGKLQDESPSKFHDHEGMVGLLLAFLRLVSFAWFLWALRGTAADGGMRLLPFLTKFKLAGSLYFLSYPLLAFVVSFLAPYWQPPIMTSGLLVMQAGSSIALMAPPPSRQLLYSINAELFCLAWWPILAIMP